MSYNSLLSPDPEPLESNTDSKIKIVLLLIGFLVVLGVSAGGFVLWRTTNGFQAFFASAKPDPKAKKPVAYSDDRYRRDILMYLASPRFSGDGFERQMLGEANLELYVIDKEEVYLSVPQAHSSPEALQAILNRILVNPKEVFMANEIYGEWNIGPYTLTKTPEKAAFFRTQAGNIKIDPKAVFQFPFKQATYTLSLKEMSDFIGNHVIFGGPLRADTDIRNGDKHLIFFNHGAFVSRAAEPSVKRLVADLTKDIPATDPDVREKKVQQLLDFVSSEIEYDGNEATSNVETLKRPNEVLMSRRADCSNKTILLGSMLEQLGEDYLFLYCPKHITIGVRQGNFPTTNGLTLEWEGKTWTIAESTAVGFQIGKDRLKDPGMVKQVRYVQRPHSNDIIYNFFTSETLEFR